MKQILDHTAFLSESLCYLGYLWAADKFCKKYLGSPRKNPWLFLILSFSGWLFLDMMNRQYPVPYILLAAVNHIFFVGLVLLWFWEGREKKILAASVLIAVMTLVGNFCVSFVSCLMLLFRFTAKKTPVLFLEEWESSLIICVGLFSVILTVYWLSNHLMSVFFRKPGRWYISLAVPLFAVVAVIDVANWGAANGIMVRSGNVMGPYYDPIFSHAEICVLTGLSMFAAGFYIFGMDRIYREQEKNNQYHLQIAVYKMLEEQYRQSERLRHDMKNHIIALSGLFQNKEWEKLGGYLKKMEGSGIETGGDITGNKAVDALLYQKRRRADKEKVKWECDVQMPKGCGIDEFDLCVLLGNILDNALEACKRMRCDECRFVDIQAKMVKKCLFLEVKNSMDREESFKNGFTNKEKPQEHGIGLLNVGDAVHKYNGVMNLEAKDGVFTISILIPLNEFRCSKP